MSQAPTQDQRDLAKRVAEAMLSNDLYSQSLGMRIVEAEPERCLMAMTVADQHLNGHKICHGGAIFSLADTAFAHACNSHNLVTVSQSGAMSYLAQGQLGQTLLAEAVKAGGAGRSQIYDIKVWVEETGELVALFRGQSRQIKGQVIEAAAL
jgi:acyl-CoA thioesterase